MMPHPQSVPSSLEQDFSAAVLEAEAAEPPLGHVAAAAAAAPVVAEGACTWILEPLRTRRLPLRNGWRT